MRSKLLILIITAVVILIPSNSTAQLHSGNHNDMAKGAPKSVERSAPLFNNLGNYHHKITTRSVQAQRYFNQGLTLAYAFNHSEAIRSFREAARLDPECAMCYWGVAFSLGPNINAPMPDTAVPEAWEALSQAKRLAPRSSEKEQAYIRALETRYSAKPVMDRKHMDIAFSNAMREVMKRYPSDLDAATIFAEASMDTMPWEYYDDQLKPKALTHEVIQALEAVIARDPFHAGANHFYIHAVEASSTPDRALPSAYRLADIVPGAGHLVHMPSHIYLRVGQYHEASLLNERAILADQSYINQCRAQGFYPAAYYPHNQHFLWYTAGMEGRSEVAIRTAREIAKMNATHTLIEGERFGPILPLTLARFGKWDEVLDYPKPAAKQLYPTAMYHFTRGLAFSAQRQLDAAERELSALQKIAQSAEIKPLDSPGFPGAKVIVVSYHALAGELAARRGRTEEMRRQFTTAIGLEDKLPYMEPPFWHHPVRQSYGAALVEIGRAEEAEAIYREDLKRHPANGWSLFGLLHSLRVQGKTDQAADIDKRFREAWNHADITLTASSF
jgi:tetratricopeptide (TPR) repeat protein